MHKLLYNDFKCGRCGSCCIDEKIITLTLFDIYRISEGLGQSLKYVFKNYCSIDKKLGQIHINVNDRCPFLNDDGCSIYPYRPFVCFAYPFLYTGYSIADYRNDCLLYPTCAIYQYPEDTLLINNHEANITNNIFIHYTVCYLIDFDNKFDEKTAYQYYKLGLKAAINPTVRAMYGRLLSNHPINVIEHEMVISVLRELGYLI